MKNRDYNLGVDYELSIMSTTELKNKLMKDNNLTEEDIFLHYSLNNISDVKVNCINIRGDEESHNKYSYMCKDSILQNYLLLKQGLLPNKEIKRFIGNLSIQELAKKLEIEEEPFLDENGKTYLDFINKYHEKFMFVEDSVYESCTYHEAILDTINYNLKLFNDYRSVPTKSFNEGIENTYVVINRRADGKYELIDGFYRVLYKNIERNIVVKIYNDLTDEQWFKLMINCNFWKTNVSNALFYDRGFLLGLRNRFNVKMEDYSLLKDKTWNRHDGLVDLLTNNIKPLRISSYKELKNIMNKIGIDCTQSLLYKQDIDSFRNEVLVNKHFISDLKMFKNYLGYLPDKLLKLKKLSNVDVFTSYAYQKFLNNLLRLILVYRVCNADKEMNELPENLIDIIFEDKEIKDSFIKATTMTVSGFIDNRLDLLYANLIIILDNLLSTKEKDLS